MNGMGVLDSGGRGMESGTFGLLVADVGKGGRANVEGSIPGIRSVTTFWIDRACCTDASEIRLKYKPCQDRPRP